MRRRLLPTLVAVLALVLLSAADLVYAQAQRRPPAQGGGGARPGGGAPPTATHPIAGQPGHAVPRPPGYYGGRYPGYYPSRYWGYYPGYYPWYGYYGAFYWPWYGVGYWGGYYPWGWYGYPGPYYAYSNLSDVRIQVKPREAEVYVDGSLVGIVDDFDGTFQRLHLPPGEHEIEIYAQGFQSMRQKFLLTPGRGVSIKHTMQPLAPGEPQEPRPVPAARDPGAPSSSPDQGPGQPGAPQWRQAPPSQHVESNFGALVIQVQPPGADVLIDGERWQGPDGQQRLVVQVSEGTHTVEVRKDGYQGFRAEVAVRRGETTPLNVSLLARED